MEGEAEMLIESFCKLAFYMRGSIQYEDVFGLTPLERTKMKEMIEQRLKIEMKKPMQVCIY